MRRILWAMLAAITSLAVAGPAVAAVTGPDVSNWQHPSGASIAWGKVYSAGQSFVFVKATEGTSYTNPYYSSDTAAAASAGLMHGAYDFVHPDESATAQAQYFAGVIGAQNQPGDLPPVMDLETTGGLSPSALISWVGSWLTAVTNLTHRTPMIYVSPDFWINYLNNTSQYANYPLWEADYCGCSAPMPVGGWNNSWTFWQYTSSASIPGITGSVDESYFVGSLAVLRANYAEENLTPSTTPATLTATPNTTSAIENNQLIVNGTVNPSQGGDIVTVQALLSGSWHDVGWATASPSGSNTGSYSATVPLTAVGTFQMQTQVAGNVVHAAATSPQFTVTVTPPPPGSVTASVNPSTTVAGSTVTVSGTVSPGSAGNPVDVQIYLDGSWHNVATATTDSSGGFSASVHAGLVGQFSVQVVAPATPTYLAAVSPTMTLTDTQPVNASVTASINPAVTTAGSTVTVSGTVSPGSAGNPVIVQILISGAWHDVAQASTDASGGFSASVYAGLPGKFQVRVLAPGTSTYASSLSATMTLVDNSAGAASGGPSVSVALNPTATTVGTTVVASGVVAPNGDGAPVIAQALLFGQWHDVGWATTSSAGGYQVGIHAGIPGSFQIRVLAPAVAGRGTLASPNATLTVAQPAVPQVIAFPVAYSVPRGTHLLVRGGVSGSHGGDRIVVQAFYGGVWHDLAAVWDNGNGYFGAWVYCGLPGSFPFRALALANAAHPLAISPNFTERVS
ncbi:MAG: GH25 family lysozyme [Mycobacteriales bacterium]